MTTPEKRKLTMLLVMPLFVLLFSALGFYALGGGHKSGAEKEASLSQGINTALPGAKLKKGKTPDKLDLYELAQRDSAAAHSHSAAGAFAALGWDTSAMHKAAGGTPGGRVSSAAASEAKIKEKLAEINKQISQPEPVSKPPVSIGQQDPQSLELARVEQLLKQKQDGAESSPDPQLVRLDAMLDKIRQIQNPASVKDKVVVDRPPKPDSAFKAVVAVIDGNQKVAPGGVVKLKLRDSTVIGGVHYPAGQALSGACQVTNQRLLLDIRNVRIGTSIIPVNLTVFSLDGMAGIAAPEAELGEAAGQGTSDVVSGMEFLPMDNSLPVQAATAGISAAKNLLSKKVRRIRVKLHGGQVVLLKINKS
ncbi:MAG: conjugative transposon protein TraM [Bacteroidetes bacterium]|nr:conjugative transposon protein TraM [Bacteroidota bacterium]